LYTQLEDVLNGAGEEIIGIIQAEDIKEKEKYEQILSLLPHISMEDFYELAIRGKKLHDFKTFENAKQDMDTEMWVNVVFYDEEEDNSDQDLNEVSDVEGEENEDFVDGPRLHGENNLDDEVINDGVDVSKIDAHWLQCWCLHYFTDADVLANIADELLSILMESRMDVGECESPLVELLGYDKFDLIKLIFANCESIYYCVSYHQAQSDQECESVVATSMELNSQKILQQLWKTASAD